MLKTTCSILLITSFKRKLFKPPSSQFFAGEKMPKEERIKKITPKQIKTIKTITTLFLFSITSMYITYLIYHLTHVNYVEYAFYAFSLITALLLEPLTFTIYALIGDGE
jgi:hypothetical protein